MYQSNKTISVTICDNRPVIGWYKRRQYTRQFGEKMSELAGGASVQFGRGYWISDINGLVSENNVTVWTFTEYPDRVYQELLPLIHRCLLDTRQEAMLVVISGNPEFISQDNLIGDLEV